MKKKDNDVRVGVIGFGGAGQAQTGHFSSMDGTEVTAIFDPKPEGRRRARLISPRIMVTDKFDEFMASGINAIAVCSNDKTHADYVVAAIEAGLHVVCEKPLTDSLEGCRRILNAQATANGVIAAVQHQMRFLPVHIRMKELIQSGKLGTISYIEGYYVHNLTVRASLYDNWRFTDNATPLVYSGCHFVDLIRWLLGDEVEEVMGMANNVSFPEYPESDLNVILLRFRSGVIAKVVVAFGAARPQDHSVRVYGTDASIENNLLFFQNGTYEVFSRPHLPKARHRFGQHILRGRGFRELPRRMRIYCTARLLETMMRLYGKDPEYGISSYPIRLYPHSLAVRDSLQNFVDAIRGTESLQCSLKDAARTVAVCIAGVEAYRTGKPVRVSDFWLPELN
jgi:predicted dehydrogenase